MFSGKSEELIRRLRRAQIARQKVQIFKPAIDDRYGDDHHHVAQRDEDCVGEPAEIAELLTRVRPETEVVGIDEGQFFDQELPAVCSTLADQGKRVIVAGLDQDYLGKPFEPMPQLGDRGASRRPSPSASSAARPPITRSGSSRAGSACSSARRARMKRCRRCFDRDWDSKMTAWMPRSRACSCSSARVSRGESAAARTVPSSTCAGARPPS